MAPLSGNDGSSSKTACQEYDNPTACSTCAPGLRHRTAGVWRQGAPDKDDVPLSDVLVRVSGEEEVAPPRRLHHLVQARLVDGQLLFQVSNRESELRCGGAAWRQVL